MLVLRSAVMANLDQTFVDVPPETAGADCLVYSAEIVVDWMHHSTRLSGVPEAQAFLDNITGSHWFTERFWDEWQGTGVTVKAADGYFSWSDYNTAEVGIVPSFTTDYCCIHELAHLVEPWLEGPTSHGPRWRRVEVDLVREFMSPRAAKCLRHAFAAFDLSIANRWY